jgi:hypothetical protein
MTIFCWPDLVVCQVVWLILWIHRYTRTIIHTFSHWCYRSIQIPLEPSLTSQNVTVIIPTIHNNFQELKESVQSILACQPYELLFVTTSDKYDKLVHFAKSLEAPNIRIFHVPIANKRIQVCEAIPKVKTSIIIMADDDVTWPKTILPWLLAPFEDEKIGGVGPCQRVKRITKGTISEYMYNWLGAAYIERRNFEISATHNIDGGTSCMSGRTCAFRSEILQAPLFLDGFKTERWGHYQLNADDDNFVTRWLVSNHWKTWIQYNPQCEIETTLENNLKFLYQCSRWARSNWRSNYTSLVIERHVWKQQPWSTYALHIATFTSLTLLFDPLILYLTYYAAPTSTTYSPWFFVYCQLAFMSLTKVVKLIGLFRRNPVDVMYLPVSVLFGYFHSLIKLYALVTLKMTSWGSRADGDTNDNERMSPRARRSESITLPPGDKNHPGLIRYQDEKSLLDSDARLDYDDPPFNDKAGGIGDDSEVDESDLDAASENSYDGSDSTSFYDSASSSVVLL